MFYVDKQHGLWFDGKDTEENLSIYWAYRDARHREETRSDLRRKEGIVLATEKAGRPEVGAILTYSGVQVRIVEVLNREIIPPLAADEEDADAFSPDPRYMQTNVAWRVRVELAETGDQAAADKALLNSYGRRPRPLQENPF